MRGCTHPRVSTYDIFQYNCRLYYLQVRYLVNLNHYVPVTNYSIQWPYIPYLYFLILFSLLYFSFSSTTP